LGVGRKETRGKCFKKGGNKSWRNPHLEGNANTLGLPALRARTAERSGRLNGQRGKEDCGRHEGGSEPGGDSELLKWRRDLQNNKKVGEGGGKKREKKEQ